MQNHQVLAVLPVAPVTSWGLDLDDYSVVYLPDIVLAVGHEVEHRAQAMEQEAEKYCSDDADFYHSDVASGNPWDIDQEEEYQGHQDHGQKAEVGEEPEPRTDLVVSVGENHEYLPLGMSVVD